MKKLARRQQQQQQQQQCQSPKETRDQSHANGRTMLHAIPVIIYKRSSSAWSLSHM